MNKLLSLFAFLILFSACSSRYEVEIIELDRRLVEIDSVKKILHTIDTGLVYKRLREVDATIQRLIDANDSLTKEEAIQVDDYTLNKKYYSRLMQRMPSLYDQAETLPRQIENLKRDLSRNLIEEDKAKLYFNRESLAVQSMVRSIALISDRMQSLDKSYEESREKVLILIQQKEALKETSEDS